MALATTTMPVIGDLTMKFNRHSIHDQFGQLPASIYQCFGQAKDFALYLQPNVFAASPKLGRGTLFEFKGSSSSSSSSSSREEGRCEKGSECNDVGRFRSFEYRKTHGSRAKDLTANAKKTTYANRTNITSDISSTGLACPEGIDHGSCSEDEELTGYFTRQPEVFREQVTSTGFRRTEESLSSTRRSPHGRKRPMELQEESSTTKRCCRPRLNFEKMQLNRGEQQNRDCSSETEENHTNYFRPISPQDLTT